MNNATFQRPFQRPSNALPTLPTRVCTRTPHTPPSVGSGQGALEDAARSNTRKKGKLKTNLSGFT